MTAERAMVSLFSRAIGLRVTVVLLLLLVVATGLGALLPVDYEVFRSWWYAALLGLLGLQTALCTVSRSRTAAVQALRPRRFRAEEGGSIPVAAGLTDVVARARRLGYRPAGTTPAGEVVLVKGRLQPVGFLVLHVGLLVLLCGSIWNLQGSSLVTLPLPPGERVLDRESGRQFEVLDVRPDARLVGEGPARRWELVGLEADVRLYEGADLVAEGTTGLGAPLRLEGAELVLLPALERYRVTVRAETPEGRRIDVPITSDAPEVDLPGGRFGVRVEDFAPDAARAPDGSWLRDGPLLRAPMAAIALVDRGGGARKAGADLRPGETLTYAGYSVLFVGAGYVPMVVVSRQAGQPVVFVGGLAVLAGMVLSLAFSFRQLWLRPVGQGLEVRGFARRRHQPLAEESAALARPATEPSR